MFAHYCVSFPNAFSVLYHCCSRRLKRASPLSLTKRTAGAVSSHWGSVSHGPSFSTSQTARSPISCPTCCPSFRASATSRATQISDGVHVYPGIVSAARAGKVAALRGQRAQAPEEGAITVTSSPPGGDGTPASMPDESISCLRKADGGSQIILLGVVHGKQISVDVRKVAGYGGSAGAVDFLGQQQSAATYRESVVDFS